MIVSFAALEDYRNVNLRPTWTSAPFIQIALAAFLLGLYVSVDAFDHAIANPMVMYPLMIAFGISQVVQSQNFDTWKRQNLIDGNL